MKYITNSLTDTVLIAKMFKNMLSIGDFVVLCGDLGAGKTTFTSSVFAELGVKNTVNSPTFAILKIYDSELCPLYHFDAYRIDTMQAIESGFDEIFGSHDNIIIFVEWSENVKELLPQQYWKISIEYLGENSREFDIERVE